MNKNQTRFVRAAAVLAAVLLLASPLFAQTATTQTTNSAAMTATQTTITLTSATGVTTNGELYIENEDLVVAGNYNGTSTVVPVVRGQGGTVAMAHPANALVWVASNTQRAYVFRGFDKSGTCTSTNERFLPQINVKSGNVQGCNCVTRSAGVCTVSIWQGFRQGYPDDTGYSVTLISDANYTAVAQDSMILYDTLTANRTVTLPTASVPGKSIIVVNNSNVPFVVNVSGVIAGSTTYFVSTGGSSRFIWSNSKWFQW